MQATEAEVEVDTGTMPETRPGLHVTQEGRLVGHAEVNVEWCNNLEAEPDLTIDDIREATEELEHHGMSREDMVVEADEEERKALKAEADATARLPDSATPPSHPNARCGTMQVDGVPVVSTSVNGGSKVTTSGSVDLNMSGDLEDVDVEEVARKVAEATHRASKRRGPGGL